MDHVRHTNILVQMRIINIVLFHMSKCVKNDNGINISSLYFTKTMINNHIRLVDL